MKSLLKNSKKKDKECVSKEDLAEIAYVFSKTNKSKRKCLMCGKMFNSSGPFNRRCRKCARVVKLGRRDVGYTPLVYKIASSGYSEGINFDEFVNFRD